MKNRLIKGDIIELSNNENHILLWFQSKTNNFCMQLNSKLIKATKTFKPIENKLKEFDNLKETIE